MLNKIRASMKGEPSKKKIGKKKQGSSGKTGSGWGDIIFFCVVAVVITVAIFYLKFYRPMSKKLAVSEQRSEAREFLLKDWKVELIRRLREIRQESGITDRFIKQPVHLAKEDTQALNDTIEKLTTIEETGIELEPAALQEIALIRFKLGLYNDALQLIDRGIKSAREKNPEKEAECYYSRGMILAAMSKPQEAFNSFVQALNLGKNLVSRTMEMKSQIAVGDYALREPEITVNGLSGWQLAESNYNDALKLAELMHEMDSRVHILMKISDHYFQTGNLEDARKKYGAVQGLAVEHKDYNGWVRASRRIGFIHTIREEYDKALDVYESIESAMAIPESYKIWGLIGKLHVMFSREQYKQAGEFMDTILPEMFRDMPDAESWVMYFRALIEMNEKRFEHAGEIIDDLVQDIDDQQDPDLFFSLKLAAIDILRAQSKHNEAATALQDILKTYSARIALVHRVEVDKRLGEIYMLLLDVKNARQAYDMALNGMQKLGMKSQEKAIRTRLALLQF